MSVSRRSLKAFMGKARAALQHGIATKSPLNFVVGNEAADLDSICSTIIYAYLRSTARSQTYIPLTNLPRRDLDLRPELDKLLPFAHLQVVDIITIDEIPGIVNDDAPIEADLTSWTLIDHNAALGRLGKLYAHRVTGCIDHHQDEGTLPTDTGDEPRVITKCGSCASLVVEYLAPQWDRLHEQVISAGEPADESRTWDAQLALLALGPILVDTANLVDAPITTERDTERTEYLEHKISQCPRTRETFDRDEYYLMLVDAKRDIDALSMHDVLRKDYKEWLVGDRKLGTSAVEKPVRYIIDKAERELDMNGQREDLCPDLPALAVHMRQFAASRDMALYAIMTAVYPDNRKSYTARELVVVSDQPGSRETVDRFVSQACEVLQLKEQVDLRHFGEHGVFAVWSQGNLSESRKGVAPRLRQAMKE